MVTFLLLLFVKVICVLGLSYSLNAYFLSYLLGQYRKERLGLGVGGGK